MQFFEKAVETSEEFVSLCDQYPLTSFEEIIEMAVEFFSEEQMAGEFQVSISTLDRWKRGTTLPLKGVRDEIVKEIREMAQNT